MNRETDQIFRAMVAQYSKILPQDRQDTRIYMNQSTLDAMAMDAGFPGDSVEMPTRMLGLPVCVDNMLPSGIAELRTETELDRVIRRANRDGRAFNIVKTEPLSWEIPNAPPPTLRGLLGHYWRKIKGMGKR